MATASLGWQGPRLWEYAGEDRLSALPDDLLTAILHHLDTRSALSTAVLARRWARIPRRLSALDFMVSDILPPSYNESPTTGVVNPYLRDVMEWYVRRRAMASFTDGIRRLMEADVGTGREPRHVRRLRLEFFVPEEPIYVNRLIATAIVRWGVEDLQIVVRPMHPPAGASLPCQNGCVAYLCLCLNLEARQRIRSLTLGCCCVLPPLQEFGHLTELVLQDITRPMRAESYESIFSRCPQLRSVHFRRCCTRGTGDNGIGLSIMEVDAPASEVRELIVDNCTFYGIMLRALPMLERLACSGNPVMLTFEQVPRIAHVNLSFFITEHDDYDDDYTMNDLMGGSPSMTDLVARFTGPLRWVAPGLVGLTVFHALRRLLVADVPSTWDVSWPCLILEAAPSLEALHMNALTCSEDISEMEHINITWKPSNFQQRRLEELMLIGFKQTLRWGCLVRYVMKVCTALQRVVLVKSGRVDMRGLWGGWEVVVSPREAGDSTECPWSDEEKLEAMREIKGENCFKQYGGKVVFA